MIKRPKPCPPGIPPPQANPRNVEEMLMQMQRLRGQFVLSGVSPAKDCATICHRIALSSNFGRVERILADELTIAELPVSG